MAAFDGGRQIEGLLVDQIDHEVLVVNAATNEAHALNGASAVVFSLCDGSTTRAEMATRVAERTGLPADVEIVDLALTELVDAGLVERTAEAGLTSRRQMLHRLGLAAGAAAALPLVETITMRPAAAQGSSPPPPPPLDVDCNYHVVYGPCSVTCGGGGVKSGTVVIDTPQSGNGQPCPSGPINAACGGGPCPVNCTFHFELGPCSATCGGGTMSHTQVIDTPSQNGGFCPTIPQTFIPCNEQPC